MELVAGEFDGEDVVRLLAEDDVDDRCADVADGGRAQACRAQDRREHLVVVVLPLVPVIASQGGGTGAAQPPGDLDVADPSTPASAAAAKSGCSAPAGRGDDELRALGQGFWSPRRTLTPPSRAAARSRWAAESPPSTTMTEAPRAVRARAALMPLTPRPATVTRMPSQSLP